MIELKSTAVDAELVEMEDLFSVDGKVYQIPAKPRANVALQLLALSREHGMEMAQLIILEKLLGPDGYAALSNFDGLDTKALNDIVEKAMKLTMGALENATGNSGSGSLKSVG